MSDEAADARRKYKTSAAENAARKQDRKYPKPEGEDVVRELPELEPEAEEIEAESADEPEDESEVDEPESEDK